jgi:hypothetical protein
LLVIFFNCFYLLVEDVIRLENEYSTLLEDLRADRASRSKLLSYKILNDATFTSQMLGFAYDVWLVLLVVKFPQTDWTLLAHSLMKCLLRDNLYNKEDNNISIS